MTKPHKTRTVIAVDAMGGDYAPQEIVKGALQAAKNLKNVEIALVGIKAKIEEELEKLPVADNVRVVSALSTVEMDDKATKGLRSKVDTSIAVCAKMVRDGEAAAMISAGNTGAVMSAATMIIGRIKGVPRPAIGVVLPTKKPVFILDIGANAVCKPKHLLYFGLLGSAYMESTLSVENPKIGLLNIGEEKGKGNELVNETYDLMEKSNLNFIGNIEGHLLPSGACDVVVCDGFTGNIVLKVLEGTGELLGNLLKEEIKRSLLSKFGALLMAPGLRSLYKKINPDRYGGAQLLGLQGTCLITHGRSKENAIFNSIKMALKEAEENLVEKITEKLAYLKTGE